MKLITWNINGLRSMKRPMIDILKDLNGDIVAFQETKISRSLLPEDAAIVVGFTSYFSFPKKQSGYSGVATFCSTNCTPKSAQEGLVSSSDNGSLSEKVHNYDILSLDSEGRVVITHHQIQIEGCIKSLAVINVYCPRVDPEKPERHIFKMEFLHLLEAKAYALLKEGSSVIIMGDMNISHQVIDHCDPGDTQEFNSSESRQWLSSFLGTDSASVGPKFIDAFRFLHKEQKEAYTCWNTLTGARQTNYGTRIDYILIDTTLLPWLDSCEILADVLGSDHCPVSLTLKLDAIPSLELPPICTRLWPEFAGRQQKLLNFCQKNFQSKSSNSGLKSPLKSSHSPPKKSKLTTSVPKQKSITNFFQTNQKLPEAKKCNEILELSNGNSDESNSQTPPEFTLSGFGIGSYNREQNEKSSALWKTVLRGPPKPPLCPGHQKPCVLRTVRKEGSNFGRQFFACAQPNGAASNPDSRCDFFQWATLPKRSMLKNT